VVRIPGFHESGKPVGLLGENRINGGGDVLEGKAGITSDDLG